LVRIPADTGVSKALKSANPNSKDRNPARLFLTKISQVKNRHVDNKLLSIKTGTAPFSHLFSNCTPDQQCLHIYSQQRVNAAPLFVKSLKAQVCGSR
jgi:hypothetical protein